MTVCEKNYQGNGMQQINMKNIIEERYPAINNNLTGEFQSSQSLLFRDSALTQAAISLLGWRPRQSSYSQPTVILFSFLILKQKKAALTGGFPLKPN